MKQLNACLTLILPKSLEARLIDRLLQHPDWVGPFNTHRVEGHGDPDGIESPREQVRGRAERVRTEILMDAAHASDLLADLRTDLPSPEVVWWLCPLTATGNLA